MALNLGFERLVTLDIMIYGASLALEFIALICLRIREPELKTAVQGSGRAVWSDCRGHSSGAASGVCHYSERT